MASQKVISDMITFFYSLPLKNKPKEPGLTIESYHQSLQRYLDEHVITAARICVEEMSYFPAPHDIIERVRAIAPELREDGAEMYAHCSKCGQWRWCRKEMPRHPKLECEDCYTGLNKEQRKQRVKDLVLMLQRIARRYEEAA